MATGKQGIVKATEPQHSVSVQREKQMHVQPPVPAMYIQAVSGLSSYPQSQPAAMQDAAVIPLSVPMMYANQPLPLLTLHISSGAGLQQQRSEPSASSSRPKSAGKHLCPHCGRDCLKPSVLEKHLRCHTGERPYPCPTCGISFKTQSNLYKHKRTQAHARLSSESGKETFSSQESTDSLRENCSNLSLELPNDDTGDADRNDEVLPVPTITNTSKEDKAGSETEWALCKAAVVGVIASPAHGQQVILHTKGQMAAHVSSDAGQLKSTNGDGCVPLIPNRTPLQRQEALFPKSQSHDSTDSGFSESSEQRLASSPGVTVNDPSMDLEESETSATSAGNDDIKCKVSLQKKQELEKHILKLISENSVVMDDKHLVNVRPRKMVLSKQGSIDLPMPYTYKDSFHFEMRSSRHQISGSKQNRNCKAFYSSMPTQHSTSLEHALLTRSSSLPFSMGIQHSDSTVSPPRVDDVPLSRRCSAGQIYPFKSVDQHTPSHRSLVRQVAVDGLSAVEGSLMERGILSSLSSDGDCADTAPESAVKRCRKKRAEKFAYNKWYMYGDGTFKKLSDMEKDSSLKSIKFPVSPEQTVSQGTQLGQQKDINSTAAVTSGHTSRPASSSSTVFTAQTSSQIPSSHVLVQNTPTKQAIGQPQQGLSKQSNFPTSDLSTVMNARKGTEPKGRAPETHVSPAMPSERKKQKTDEHLSVLVENTEAFIGMQQSANRKVNTKPGQSLKSECAPDVPQKSGLSSLQIDSGLNLNRHGSFTDLSSSSNQRQLLFKRHSSPLFAANLSGTSASLSVSSSISSISEAKTSFLPVYQLEIPALTDGMSDSCLGKGSLPTQSSPRQNVSLNQQPSTASPSSPETQANMTNMSPRQGQGPLCTTAITKATSMTSVSLASSLAFTDHSVTNTTQNSAYPVSHSSSPTKNIQVHTGNVSSVRDNLVIPSQSAGVTPTPVPLSSKYGIPLEISSTEIQGSQDTFYVQTADLQIVMQLISDEQLALIEPQIETQDYKTNEDRCFLSKDSETSLPGTIQTGVSQEMHEQCSGDTGSKLDFDQGNVNSSVLTNIPDITLMPTGSAVTDHKAKCTKSAQDAYLTNAGTKGVISKPPSKSGHDASVLSNCKSLGQQCKLVGSTPTGCMAPTDPETVVCGVRAYPKPNPSEKQSKPLAEKPTARSESEESRSSAHNQDNTDSRTISLPNVTLTNSGATSTEGQLVKPFVSPSEISKRSPTFQPLQMTNVQKDKTFGVSSALDLPLTTVSSLNHDKPLQCNFCQPPNTSLARSNETRSQNVLACRVCPQQPGQHSSREVWSKTEEVRTITAIAAHMAGAQFKSHGLVLNQEEEKIKIQDSFTGQPLNCCAQSFKFHREAGTARQTWNPLEPKSREREGAEQVGTCDVRSTWTAKEEVEEAKANKREEANCSDVYHKAVKPLPDLSTSQHLTNSSTALPELDSISITTTICGTSNTSPDSKCLTNKDITGHCLTTSVAPKHVDQSNTNLKEHVSSGCHERFKGPGDTRHLLAHPLLVNSIKELSHSANMQVQRPEQGAGEGAHTSVLSCKTEQCQIKKTPPMYRRPSSSIKTSSSCIHSNPSYTSSMHNNPPEASAPHSCTEEEENVEEEERSSSSDDEGKLVIELE